MRCDEEVKFLGLGSALPLKFFRVVLLIVWRPTKVIVGVNVRSLLMGRGRLSVISAYGYARHERTSAPAQANTPLVAERRVEYAQHY